MGLCNFNVAQILVLLIYTALRMIHSCVLPGKQYACHLPVYLHWYLEPGQRTLPYGEQVCATQACAGMLQANINPPPPNSAAEFA